MMELDKSRVVRIIKAALKEDIAKGDISTDSIIPRFESVKGGIFANEECVVCGIEICEWILSTLDYSVRFKPLVSDGDVTHKGKEIAFFEGRARAILTAERTMLNFLSFLSGISTETRKYVDKTSNYNVKILDTRKTFPLLRYLQKYAVSVGGGYNHRMSLSDMVIVKDNHLAISNEKCEIKNVRNKIQKNIKIEVEVEGLDHFERILKDRPDVIMLDNMDAESVKKAVQIREACGLEQEVELEVSGGITLETVEAYAATGVEGISVGALTDSVRGIDFSLNFVQ